MKDSIQEQIQKNFNKQQNIFSRIVKQYRRERDYSPSNKNLSELEFLLKLQKDWIRDIKDFNAISSDYNKIEYPNEFSKESNKFQQLVDRYNLNGIIDYQEFLQKAKIEESKKTNDKYKFLFQKMKETYDNNNQAKFVKSRTELLDLLDELSITDKDKFSNIFQDIYPEMKKYIGIDVPKPNAKIEKFKDTSTQTSEFISDEKKQYQNALIDSSTQTDPITIKFSIETTGEIHYNSEL